MVRKIVVSEYSSNPPEEAHRTKISDGPLYDLVRVKAIIADENQLQLWTRKCRLDVQNLFDSDFDRVVALLESLQASEYVDSEWCDNGAKALAACDAYRCQRREMIPSTGKYMMIDYFLKFAIGKTGQLVLVVSCHV